MNIDYKIFINILIQKLTAILNKIINLQQSIFLLKKFIDDNIKTIQYLIIKYKNFMKFEKQQFELLIIFLNQKKIYNKINHEFLFAILTRFDVLKKYIF